MILTHESGSQVNQFDGKKRTPKISWYYPFKVNGSLELEILHLIFIGPVIAKAHILKGTIAPDFLTLVFFHRSSVHWAFEAKRISIFIVFAKLFVFFDESAL
jgi:hypothetical protein